MEKQVICPLCNGNKKCVECQGKRSTAQPGSGATAPGAGIMPIQIPCTKCGGNGTCPKCHGSGLAEAKTPGNILDL